MSRRQTLEKIPIVFVLVFGALLAFIPLFWLVRSSFMSMGELYLYPPLIWSKAMHWSNYTEAMATVDFALCFRNTMTIMVPVMIGTVLTSSMSAYGFARLQFPFKRFWFIMIISSMMLPYAVTMLPTFLMWSKIGGVDTFLPLTVPVWFGGGAFNVFLLRQFFMTIPNEIEDAAVMDGAGFFDIYLRIMLPLVKPALIVVALFTFMNVWNDFLNPLIYLNDVNLYTLALGLLQFRGSFSSAWHLLMAGSTLVVIPPILVFLFGQKYFIEGVTLSGMKL